MCQLSDFFFLRLVERRFFEELLVEWDPSARNDFHRFVTQQIESAALASLVVMILGFLDLRACNESSLALLLQVVVHFCDQRQVFVESVVDEKRRQLWLKMLNTRDSPEMQLTISKKSFGSSLSLSSAAS